MGCLVVFFYYSFMRSFSLFLAALALTTTAARAQAPGYSALVQPGPQGRLRYVPDARGNTVPDFSDVGYRNGETAIPTVPVVRTLTPVAGDNRAQLQAAIDQVAALPLQADGFRGAVLLRAGTYPLGGSVVVRASGIVLRGEGQATVLLATLRQQHTLVQFVGAGGAAGGAGRV